MIGKVNHIAMVVNNLAEASATYQDILGAKVSKPQTLVEHGVSVVFVELPNTKVELLEPLGDGSPVSNFLEKNRHGGMHHICFEVEDIHASAKELTKKGAQVLGDGTPKVGAHGNLVLFLHPKHFHGCLIELEQVS